MSIISVDYNKIQQSSEILESYIDTEEWHSFEDVLTELSNVSKKHDGYLSEITSKYQSNYTPASFGRNNTAFKNLVENCAEIAKYWKDVEFDDETDVKKGFKKIDELLGLKDNDKLSKKFSSIDFSSITFYTNAQDVEGFITSAVDISDYYPDGYESRDAWKQALIQNYLNQGYSQESAESLAALEMARSLVSSTGAYNTSQATSINSIIDNEVSEVQTKNAWYASQVTPVETD